MATLRRHLRGAREEYYRCKSEYLTYVKESLELEDTIKNYERRSITGWKFISSFRPERTGRLGQFLDLAELVWRCILQKQLEKILSVILGCMSAAILLAEATLLTNGVDLSLFSILIKSVGYEEVLVQVIAFVPLMFMCVCTYYSLFKVGRLMFYSLTPKQSSAVSLLMICSMVARYAPAISYNFLNLISLGDGKKTIFEQCRKQPGPTECGYYVMRYMYDIANNFPNSKNIGVDWISNQDPYSPLEFDNIRNVFARYFIDVLLNS